MFTRQNLELDPPRTVSAIEALIREQVFHVLRRQGVVLGISGGIDSSVVAALCVRALGPRRVFGLFLPEAESSPDSLALGQLLAAHLGIQSETECITPILEGAGCYRRRDDAIRLVVPAYGKGWKSKVAAANSDFGAYTFFNVVVESPDGVQSQARLTAPAYLGVVAATNFKQRTRKMMEYYHADRLNFAVAGTPNRLEYDQGFFVKNGDGSADLKPIAHLYKSQVYQIAEYLGIPEVIRRRPPTTDTFSLEQSQEEFYFSLPYDLMDLCLYGKNEGIPAGEVAAVTGMALDQVARVYSRIDATRRATAYLHRGPLLAEQVDISSTVQQP